MRIDQIVVGIAEGDAITNMALNLREELRLVGDSDLYSEFILSDLFQGDVYEISKQVPSLMVDATVYHLSYGRPAITSHLIKRREPLILAYHNVTPPHWYLAHNPDFAAGLEWGRYELRQLRNRCVLAIADSEFNAAELRAEGFNNVHVVPAGFDPFRLRHQPTDLVLANLLSSRFPRGYVLAVGQILPHKQVELLIEAVHLANSIHRLDLGLVIAGVSRQHQYTDALQAFQLSLPLADVWMTGAVSDQQLATLYRQAKCFLTMSGHEGLCIPPVEAMAMGVPVVARGVGAITETVSGAGILIQAQGSPVEAAEALKLVIENTDAATLLRAHGFNRATHFSSLESSKLAAELIVGLFK